MSILFKRINQQAGEAFRPQIPLVMAMIEFHGLFEKIRPSSDCDLAESPFAELAKKIAEGVGEKFDDINGMRAAVGMPLIQIASGKISDRTGLKGFMVLVEELPKSDYKTAVLDALNKSGVNVAYQALQDAQTGTGFGEKSHILFR